MSERHPELGFGAANGAATVEIDPTYQSASVGPERPPFRVPFFVPRTQAYYWSREWQRGEAEADAELGRGEARAFDDPGEALRWLDDPEN